MTPTPPALDSATIRLVKASVPFLTEHGEKLTRCFYRRLFSENPEVLAFFNQAHQHSGGQQRALAGAICAYAMHIDNPGVLAGAIAQITQKHVSLSVQPEHYPIVGKHLLAAIRELLGDQASEELIAAWGNAYGFLADVFIHVEAEHYMAHTTKPGGWKGRRAFRVRSKVEESVEIASFHLEPEDGEALPDFLPGQYITLFPSGKNPSAAPRNYSLSHNSGKSALRISVKREKAGGPGTPEGTVSSFLHDQIEPGDRVEVGPPCGVFHLDPAVLAGKTVVLLSAGVGQTPVLAMVHALAEANTAKRVIYVHVARNGKHHAFRQEIETLKEGWPALTVRYLYTRPEAEDLETNRHQPATALNSFLWQEALSDSDAEFYFCGPKRFMHDVRKLLGQLSVPKGRQHCEFFGPMDNSDS